MNILLLNQFYLPDPAPTGKLVADLAERLAASGDNVTVVCGQSAYSGGPAPSAPGKDETHGRLRIVRLPAFRFSHGWRGRLLAYASFFFGALLRSMRMPAPDVVVTLTTPPLLPVVGAFTKKLRGARHVIWEMDVYPDVAVDLGIMKAGSAAARLAGTVLDYCRRNADCLIALGDCMRLRLLNRGIPDGIIRVAENWADSREIPQQPFPKDGPLTVLYSGNLGLAHDVETIAGALDVPGCRFVFRGGGPQRAALERHCRQRGHGNVEFVPYASRDALAEGFGNADLCLVTQKASCCGSVVPSKLYTVMAAGRPVLFIGPGAATPAQVVKRHHCGWQIEPGDVASLRSLLGWLVLNREALHTAGENARRAFDHHYDIDAGAGRVASILRSLSVKKKPAGGPKTEPAGERILSD